MTLEPLAITTVASTSVASVMFAAVGGGLDPATVTVIGAVASAVITTLSIAIVKILAALQELKVAVIKAAEERKENTKQVNENSEKLTAIGVSTDGSLSAMRRQLDEATKRIDEMQKAALSAAEDRAEMKAPAAGPAPGAPPVGSPGNPMEMIVSNTEDDPANVKNIQSKNP